jgi:hypothetical protein
MTLAGIVQNGKIVLEPGATLPEGTRVKVIPEPGEHSGQPTLLGLLELAGKLDDLPPDFAAEHDHYIHGTPRRKPKEN